MTAANFSYHCMGKQGGISWFTAVKRAFRSPTKRREENEKREKKRWIFRKPSANHEKECETKMTTNAMTPPDHHILEAEQRHAIAAAAVEIIRLTRPWNFVREEEYAAVIIQAAFRGYLARRALRALQGLVKLQALVRGHNVRRRAKMMVQRTHALARVQAQVGDRRSMLSQEGSRNSMFAESNDLWESRYLQSIRDIKEAALKREKSLAYAFSHKISRTERNKSAGNESGLEERTKWLDRWMSTKQWESSKVSTDKIDTIKTFEIDAFRPNHVRRQQQQASPRSLASPRNKAHNYSSLHSSPRTPPPSKIRQLSVHSVSPRCLKEERSYSTTHKGSYCFTGGMCRASASVVGAVTTPVPNYMAATESAKAKVRAQSTPRTRPSTPERERCGSARKRLSYPVPEPQNSIAFGRTSVGQNLRSPSFQSVEGILGMEQQSNLYSYHTDSIGGEISPCSTTNLRQDRPRDFGCQARLRF